MNLYEINEQIESILSQVDENGELTDEVLEQLEQLAIDEQTKVENTALFIKHLLSDAKAIRQEEISLAERRRNKESKAERLKGYLSAYLAARDYKKYETSKVALSFRSSSPLAIGDKDELIRYLKANYADLVKVTEDIDKTGVKKLIQDGHEIPHAVIEDKQNIQIK